ncbi:MAG: hypothetical protein AAGA54_21915 [Myxococcota bacterium]
MKRLTVCSILLALGACDVDPGESEAWMAPAKVGGKADAIATLTGADIPSDFADDDAMYLHDRSIYALQQVDGLPGVLSSLAERADGIIDALPADGRLDVEELVRMEESPYFDLLFPEEQAALPDLWPLLEVPDSAIETVGFDDFAPLEIEDRSIDPGELELPQWLQINDFPAQLRDSLRRMELAFDDDGDDDTVSIEDIDGAIAAPGAFTPSELAHIEAAREHYLLQGESTLAAITAVPTPGVMADEVAIGDITIARSSNTEIHESRRWSRSNNNSYSYSVNMEVEQDRSTWPVLEEGQQLLIIESLDENDRVLEANPQRVQAGVYLVELWQDGERLDTQWIELPELGASQEHLDIRERVGHALETFDGEPLQSNVRSASWSSSTWNTSRFASFTWDLGPEEPTGDVDASIVAQLALPRTTYTPGRYVAQDNEGNDIVLDIFPEGPLRATYNGATSWMYLNSNGSSEAWARRHTAQTGDRYVHYQVVENRLMAWQNRNSGTHYFANINLQLTDREG